MSSFLWKHAECVIVVAYDSKSSWLQQLTDRSVESTILTVSSQHNDDCQVTDWVKFKPAVHLWKSGNLTKARKPTPNKGMFDLTEYFQIEVCCLAVKLANSDPVHEQTTVALLSMQNGYQMQLFDKCAYTLRNRKLEVVYNGALPYISTNTGYIP